MAGLSGGRAFGIVLGSDQRRGLWPVAIRVLLVAMGNEADFKE